MKWYWRLAFILLYPLARLFLSVKNRHFLPKGGAIIVCNHTSNLDPILLSLGAFSELFFLAKVELFSVNRFFSWLLRTFNAIPLNRLGLNKEVLQKVSDLLKANEKIVIFPEGTRSKTGQLGNFKLGASFLAIKNKVPIVPCFIAGVRNSFLPFLFDRDLVKYGSGQWRIPKISVIFSKPISVQGLTLNKSNCEYLNKCLKKVYERDFFS